MIETGIYAQLMATLAVTDLVVDRVYPIMMPQQPTLPAITYQRISTTDRYAQDGSQDLPTVRVQINCVAATLAAAGALSAAVRTALDVQHGTTWDGHAIGASRRVGSVTLFEPSIEAYMLADDYLITFADV